MRTNTKFDTSCVWRRASEKKFASRWQGLLNDKEEKKERI
jgi:hypothetical protein